MFTCNVAIIGAWYWCTPQLYKLLTTIATLMYSDLILLVPASVQVFHVINAVVFT